MEGMLKKLQTLSESDFYPYHMPGHKRCGNPYFALDITEIDGFDNLHHATGMIKKAQERAAKLYGALESYFLVNGSTCGILAAMFASFQKGDKVLVARNCHKSVYHALEIRGLRPIYIYPETDEEYDISVGITAKQVEEAIEQHNEYRKEKGLSIGVCNYYDSIKGMVLTSPTYEGITSDIKEIAEVLHKRDIILIVDEAHGAHFGFHEAFPESAIKQGADLVIQSLHKTLPSMTQTALLHRCSERVSVDRVQKYLGIFQTSSPSYIFMAHMDECVKMLEKKGPKLFQGFAERLDDFYKSCEDLKHIKIRKTSDPGKILIKAEACNGRELYDILRTRFHLQMEMCAGNYVLGIMTICDSKEGYTRLRDALFCLDDEFAGISCDSDQDDKRKTLVSLLNERPDQYFRAYEAETRDFETITLSKAAGRMSGEYMYLYPPGIPFIVPGEIFTKELVKGLKSMQKMGYELQGTTDRSGKTVKVVI
ncbi:MAG: aminotransferase class I/II-fold pyridoxal phosphate-dependent enzyme [Lachnospiraceae bacterium]|nr:aminotransferase class I/II-fold pyridoxal phosphate-dependent enzyme [Lachnospiraceae bacterium]